MTDKHVHTWTTRYVTIEGVDTASGMQCTCGATLHQDDVEDVLGRLAKIEAEMLAMVDTIARLRTLLITAEGTLLRHHEVGYYPVAGLSCPICERAGIFKAIDEVLEADHTVRFPL